MNGYVIVRSAINSMFQDNQVSQDILDTENTLKKLEFYDEI